MRRAIPLLLLLLPACAALGPGPDPRSMTFPAPVFTPPRPERHVLDNGLVVFLLEDRELPLVAGKALLRTGAVFDPPGKTGLARLTGRLLTQGGTGDLPGSRLDEVLEARAIELSSEIGSQSGSVSLSALAADTDVALGLFADVLRRPAFHPDKLELAKKRLADEIRRIPDDPDDLAFREFRRLLYAKDPRGRAATVPEVEALTGYDVASFHLAFFHPDRIILGFSGDFDRAALLVKIERLFGDWAPSGEAPPPLPIPDPAAADRGLNLIDRDLPQATIALGHLAPAKDSPDYVPFLVADFILGSGGFSSRLTREIRSNRGLAYSVGSFYRGDIGYGVFTALCKTKNETAPEALGLLLEIAGEEQRGGVTEEELSWARDSLMNAMIFRYSSSAAVMGESLSLEYDRLPPDFPGAVRERLRTLTRAEVNAAAAQYLHPAAATLVVLGHSTDYRGAWPEGRAVREWRLTPTGQVE